MVDSLLGRNKQKQGLSFVMHCKTITRGLAQYIPILNEYYAVPFLMLLHFVNERVWLSLKYALCKSLNARNMTRYNTPCLTLNTNCLKCNYTTKTCFHINGHRTHFKVIYNMLGSEVLVRN